MLKERFGKGITPAGSGAILVFLLLAAQSPRADGGEVVCGEGVVSSTGYPAGLLFKKLGFGDLYASQGAEEGVESDALREVRELEEIMFPLKSGAEKLARILGTLSVFIAGIKGAGSAELDAGDLEWLQSLSKPDLPVRWSGKVVKYLKSFKEEKRWQNVLRGWFERKDLYGPMIRAELGCRGLPVDLEYVAMIESGYNPYAESPAGAAGIWQFMPATGTRYGLVRTSWMDQRRNPEISTVSAALYLKDLKARLGSWALALAAYNAGYGSVLEAVKMFNTNDYWALSEIEGALAWETTNYVPKLVAVAVAARNPGEFGLKDIKPLDPVSYNLVQVPIPVKLSVVARSAGVPVEAIAALNPEIIKKRVPPDVLPYPVRIPAGVDPGEFERKFGKLCEGYEPLVQYRVKFGDTLTRIASMSKTTLSELLDLNDLGRDEKLIAGTLMLVPKAIEESEGAAVEGEKGGKKVVVVPGKDFDLPGKKRLFYEVVKGDTLSEIARFFMAKLSETCFWNDLDPEAIIVPGMILQLFVDPSFDVSGVVVLEEGQVEVMKSGSMEHMEFLLEKEGKRRALYTAAPGDTLESIAGKFGVKASSLASINKLDPGVQLNGGEEVVLYVTPQVYKKHFAAGKRKAGKKEKGEEE